MSKAYGFGLIASLAFVSAVSLPRSSCGQTVYGTWTGTESYDIQYILPTGQIITESGASDPAVMNLELDVSQYPFSAYGFLSISDLQNGNYGGGVFGFLENGFVFASQFADGTIDYLNYPTTSGFGNFDVGYNWIAPDGALDTTNDFAVADLFYGIYDFNTGIEENVFITFQGVGVPEPSSLVPAASAALMLLIFGWMRGVFSLSVRRSGSCRYAPAER